MRFTSLYPFIRLFLTGWEPPAWEWGASKSLRRRSSDLGDEPALDIRSSPWRRPRRIQSRNQYDLPHIDSRRKRRLLTDRGLLVPVTAECGTRRGHRGCVCGLRERRDGDQRCQRESGDKYPHDSSPCCGTLSVSPDQDDNRTSLACHGRIIGDCFSSTALLPSPIGGQ